MIDERHSADKTTNAVECLCYVHVMCIGTRVCFCVIAYRCVGYMRGCERRCVRVRTSVLRNCSAEVCNKTPSSCNKESNIVVPCKLQENAS